MVRSAHKKSRRGCATCKQRHVKCDESKPSCINCVTVNRRCGYLDVDAPLRNSSSNSPAASNLGSSSSAISLPPEIPKDLLYVHALNQWMNSTQEIFCPANFQQHHPGTIMLNYALEEPFLLHGLLALSTFHLGTCQPNNQEEYHNYSRRLLSQGLHGFNGIVTRLDKSNILPAFVFSSVAGFCKFAHVFSTMHQSINDFLDQMIDAVTMLRGINIVLQGWWDFIISSTLFKALYPEVGPPKVEELGNGEINELSDLKLLLQKSNLDSTSIDVCRQTISQLNSLYENVPKDDTRAEAPEFIFFIRMPGAFHTLVLQRTPEALIIIAYLAPLLHRRRHFWLVGNAGQVLINAVLDYLGPEWTAWLQAPITAIKSDLENSISIPAIQ